MPPPPQTTCRPPPCSTNLVYNQGYVVQHMVDPPPPNHPALCPALPTWYTTRDMSFSTWLKALWLWLITPNSILPYSSQPVGAVGAVSQSVSKSISQQVSQSASSSINLLMLTFIFSCYHFVLHSCSLFGQALETSRFDKGLQHLLPPPQKIASSSVGSTCDDGAG